MLIPFYKKGCVEAGVDEAGRGCLAGPVVAAAVILRAGYRNEGLNDSKKLSRVHREELKAEIIEDALDYGIGMADNLEIDHLNVLQATMLAMHRAIGGLKTVPEFLIIDGNRFNPFRNIPHQCLVKGDALYMSIAAASILAKTHRDEMMRKLVPEYPEYGWERNVGYPTRGHRAAIRKFGVTPLHRNSFRLYATQMELFNPEPGHRKI
ncbi:MAG TPA: ribonuclease HII [Cyclobacteriaceae bacterium]|nr:ribonuclease HII [Cyclobacteriaceae bacterium]